MSGQPGERQIGKLLVANRGEIAARIMRTAHGLGIATVAVYSDPDADAPYVTLADEAVRLPGAASADTYLRGDLIIAAAAAAGADAVHPGYGFLSENQAFARACADAGLIFVGPGPDTIAAMGSKVEAKALMAAAGVPVLPGVTVAGAEDIDTEDIDTGGLAAAAAGVGFPLLVKAAFGGGGRGMRLVRDPAGLAEAVRSARGEAASAFGDGTVFLERFVVDPRHVEVQILGDTAGHVVHLFERECSIQRRYQKIVEECPSPAVDDGLRAALTAAAVTAGQAIGYTGAGTVEFVLDRDGAFYFLEVNGSVISPHYDAMLAKVIAHGRTRADAARRLARTLARAEIHGVTTNRDLLAAILREPEFLAGQTDTYTAAGAEFAVAYRVTRGVIEATANDEPVGGTLLLHAAGPELVDLEVDGLRHLYRVHRAGAQTYVDASNGSSALAEVARFGQPDKMSPTGSLLAPMPGLVLRVLASVGATVTSGQPLVVLEAMKMEQTVTAPADGVVAELRVKAGEQVSTGQVLAVVATGEPDAQA